MKKLTTAIVVVLCLVPFGASAQRVLTLDECKQLAAQSNNDLKTAQTKVEMAGYDRKIAAANYFPNISAMGTYQWADHSLKIISDEQTQALQSAGTVAQQNLSAKMTTAMTQSLTQLATTNPATYQQLAQNGILSMIQQAAGAIDIATPINAISSQLISAFDINTQNIVLGAVTLEQPLFVGGKIIASNKMAVYAKKLAETQLEQQKTDLDVEIEQAYWQIVSIASKKKLAQSYSDLLKDMLKDTDALVEEGFATGSDALAVEVKANEADLLLTKATNGLSLSKMLLCQKCGLPLDSDIVLADEGVEEMPVPQTVAEASDEEIYAGRPEVKSLELAQNIYKQKVNIARADMMPTVALTANYLVTNPNFNHGFQDKFGGIFAAGVVMKVPIFHGTEKIQKTNKAKAEARLMTIKLEDAKQKISLQVAQCRKQENEAFENLNMTKSVLNDAEENLRKANAGYREGVVSSNVVLQAQTAWLKAHSEYIEAGVNLQMCSVNLAKAEGRL